MFCLLCSVYPKGLASLARGPGKCRLAGGRGPDSLAMGPLTSAPGTSIVSSVKWGSNNNNLLLLIGGDGSPLRESLKLCKERGDAGPAIGSLHN